ncbi:MAG TPA: haloacid dehalogenase type II, partial [Pirellulales bacterium]|nr:haloacid dehalogenase type II [Pirellulales bacterium]
MPIKGLIFDAYGTLYDVHSVHTKTEELCPGKGDLITQIWRLKQLEYTWLQTALQGYRDFDFITRSSLIFALRAAEIEPNETTIKPLLDKYLDLDPFPEAKEALGALKRRGDRQLAILSNGSTAMLSALVKNSGLDAFLDATISVDGARKYKPHPECYALIEERLGAQDRRGVVRLVERLRCRRRQAFRLQGCLDQTRRRWRARGFDQTGANVSAVARQCGNARLRAGLHRRRSDRFDHPVVSAATR